ncbi:MMPL family transporter [Actinoplanes sp. NPDC051513]|uniref:MMPL family transporter n=1 Tax=Actinoplanes sp. NPDC051513 TaxID=3363908 RepID=UPI00379CFAC6
MRSFVAPLYLMGGVVLGFLATLGGAVVVFQVLAGRPGLSFQLPLVVYLFVASIGTDYNVLMISRLREEMLGGAPARQAVRRAIRYTGPSVPAAGLILAGSFATLTLSTLLQQIGVRGGLRRTDLGLRHLDGADTRDDRPAGAGGLVAVTTSAGSSRPGAPPRAAGLCQPA